MSNKELVNAYLNSLSLLSKETIDTRRYFLYEVARDFEQSLLELKPTDIRNYIIKKKELNIWKKPSTISVYITLLKMFYKFLINEKYLKEEDDPVKNLKAPKNALETEVRPLNNGELKKLLNIVNAPVISLKEKLIFFLALTSSLRATELCNIKKENINLKDKLIYIPKDDVKGRYRAKLVPFSEGTKNLLETYLIKYPTQSEYLFENKFGKKLSRILIYRAIKAIIDLAYPYKGSWKKPSGSHIARHTFATRWIESKGDLNALRAIMGWQNFQQLDRYVNVSEDFIKNAAQKVEKKLLKVI